MLLRGVDSEDLHQPGVWVVLVVEGPEPDVSQDPKVARAASHHCPEQIIIARNQLVGTNKLAGKKGGLRNISVNNEKFLTCLVSRQ